MSIFYVNRSSETEAGRILNKSFSHDTSEHIGNSENRYCMTNFSVEKERNNNPDNPNHCITLANRTLNEINMTSGTPENVSLIVVREAYEPCGFEEIIGDVKTCDSPCFLPFCLK